MSGTRQQRRAAEREFEARGIPAERGLGPLVLQTRRLLAILDRAGDPARASTLARAAQAGLDLSMRRYPPGARKPECRKGCHFCCHGWVSVSAPEALLLARAVRHRPGIAERVAATREAIAGLSSAQRSTAAIPCALLEGGICSVYPDRPVVCRSVVSLSVAACEAAFHGADAGIPLVEQFMIVRGAHAHCLWAALRAHGLPITTYELNSALAAALAPDAETRWLAGEDVFAAATPDAITPEQAMPRGYLEQLIAGARG